MNNKQVMGVPSNGLSNRSPLMPLVIGVVSGWAAHSAASTKEIWRDTPKWERPVPSKAAAVAGVGAAVLTWWLSLSGRNGQ
jgi:hypothetical protein